MKKWTKSIIVVTLIFIWELLGSLNLMYFPLISHPIEIVKTIADWSFLRSFGYIFFVPLLAIIPGIAIGLALGFLIMSHQRLALTVSYFLRLTVWLPFLLYWTLPFWPAREPNLYRPMLWIVGTSIVAVALHSCYIHLTSQSILRLSWHDARQRVTHGAILQAVLISLFSQFSLPDWYWRLSITLRSVSVLYGVLLLLIVVLFLIEKIFGKGFDENAEFHTTVLVEETKTSTWSLVLTSTLPVVVCLVFWLFLGPMGFYEMVISPLDVLKRLFDLLAYPTVLQGQSLTIWGHMGLSLLEITYGIGLSLALGFITLWGMSLSQQLKGFLSPLLPLTYCTSLVVPLVLVYWQMFDLLSHTGLLASLIPP
jgi:ABC-type nitrate/sulfonate/bicarbonate transport system permease component